MDQNRPPYISNLESEQHGLYAKATEVKDVDEISLKEIVHNLLEWFKYLKSKWAIVLMAGIIGGVVGLVYASLNKPVYTATTTFVLESGDGGGSGLGQYAGLASMVGIDLGGGGGGIFQGDNIIELYKSRTMIEKTLLSETLVNGEKILLIDRYVEMNNLRRSWNKNPQLSNIRFSLNTGNNNRVQDSILGETVKDINRNFLSVSKPDKKLNIIMVQVKAKDEIFAKILNEQIVKNVNNFYLKTKIKKTQENVTILQQKTDSVRAVMNGAIYSAASVADATPNLNLTRQVQRVAPIQRSQFAAETNKAVLGELVKNLEMSKIALRKETPLIQVIDQPVYPLEKERFSKAKGIILGGIMMAFLVLLALSLKRIYYRIVSE